MDPIQVHTLSSTIFDHQGFKKGTVFLTLRCGIFGDGIIQGFAVNNG